MKKIFIVSILSVSIFTGCVQHTPIQHKIDNRDKITAGQVQTSIRKGMSSAEVVEALGSPNMVTLDENGNEVWVYDKVSSMIDATWYLYRSGYANAEKNQSTLTIIIKLDSNKKVQSFTYRQSKF